MSEIDSAKANPTRRIWSHSIQIALSQFPFVFWMIAGTIVLAIFSGMNATQTIKSFNAGFGKALGEFTLILLPAFTLAAALAQFTQSTSPKALTAMLCLAPISGAGMVCPDTAYAALAPAARANTRHKLAIAFGAYGGFKLLFPAGPLLVATTLGVQNDPKLVWLGICLTIPVWLVGLLWARMVSLPEPKIEMAKQNVQQAQNNDAPIKWKISVAPFALLIALVGAGIIFDFSQWTILDFATRPKGALIIAAIYILSQLPVQNWRPCLEQASRRTANLLLLIGSASAFGAVLTSQLDLSAISQLAQGKWLIFSLFGLTVLFKLIQGSSLATFAAITPVAAPIINAADISPVAATFAICIGSFIAILPNDSFYWLVRRDALAHILDEKRIIYVLSGGAFLQAMCGLVFLWIIIQWI